MTQPRTVGGSKSTYAGVNFMSDTEYLSSNVPAPATKDVNPDVNIHFSIILSRLLKLKLWAEPHLLFNSSMKRQEKKTGKPRRLSYLVQVLM